MPRSRQRICLQQQALKLDFNLLTRRGLIAPGSATGPHAIRWVNSNGEVIASGWISADMAGDARGLFYIRIDELDQRIALVTLPRHLGGRQWFFVCPVLTAAHRSYGCLQARRNSPASTPGQEGLPTDRNS